MQAIELKDFLSFYAMSDLQWAPDGHAAALIAHRADEGKNGYDSNLWLYTPEKPLRQLTAQGDVKSFVWDGSEALLFPTLRDEADKALRASGEEHTAFYRLPLSGGEAERVFTVPLNASVIGKLGPSTYVLKARKELEKEARLKNLTGEARREALKQLSIEREHFTVFDEYPFWFNGSGFPELPAKAENGPELSFLPEQSATIHSGAWSSSVEGSVSGSLVDSVAKLRTAGILPKNNPTDADAQCPPWCERSGVSRCVPLRHKR